MWATQLHDILAYNFSKTLGLGLLITFLIIMIIEIYCYKRFDKFGPFIIGITVIAFILAFLANENSDTNLISSIIAMTGTLLGVMLTLLIDISRDARDKSASNGNKTEEGNGKR
jgi:uncharacterized membrane protein